jgi:hypothetical protein
MRNWVAALNIQGCISTFMPLTVCDSSEGRLGRRSTDPPRHLRGKEFVSETSSFTNTFALQLASHAKLYSPKRLQLQFLMMCQERFIPQRREPCHARYR